MAEYIYLTLIVLLIVALVVVLWPWQAKVEFKSNENDNYVESTYYVENNDSFESNEPNIWILQKSSVEEADNSLSLKLLWWIFKSKSVSLLILASLVLNIIEFFKIFLPKNIKKTQVPSRKQGDNNKEIITLQEEFFISKAINASNNNLNATSVTFITKAIELEQRPDLYVFRAFVNSHAFNFEKSIEDINTAIALLPEKKELHSYRGILFIKANKIKEAIAAWKIGSELGCEESIEFSANYVNKKSAWLEGIEYFDHFFVEFRNEYLFMHEDDNSEYKTTEKIRYLNQSTYTYYLN